MARKSSVLTSPAPTSLASADITIGHVQLRDLLICPRERGVVNYVQRQSIVEHDMNVPDSSPHAIADLTFTPNTLASLPVANSDHTLLAAGGQDAEIHISLHAPLRCSSSISEDGEYSSKSDRHTKCLWQFESGLPGSINNSVLLTSLSLTKSNESSAEPRVGISNNDCTVKFYDIPVRGKTPPDAFQEAGALRLDVPVNHSSISPDGRTLLSVGDSPKVYLHHMSGGSRINFNSIATLSLPPPDFFPPNYSSCIPASFSTSFSANGTKFAVASQEGVLVVWDVRSTKPLKVLNTDKFRSSQGKCGNGNATGYLSDDPWDWSRGTSHAPGWGIRTVKFGPGGESGNPGKEVMIFTEHSSVFHIVDARTFETEEIVHVPSGRVPPRSPRAVSPCQNPTRNAISRAPSQHPSLSPSFVRALEDTFRISSSPPGPSASSVSTQWPTRPNQYQEEDFVVIPSLGDRQVENDVQRLLGQHGIRSRQSEAQGETREEFTDNNGARDEEMEVDELESDCASSHTPSRSSSPSPSNHIPIQPSPRVSPAPTFAHGNLNSLLARNRRVQLTRDHYHTPDLDKELDLAGSCFDPTGAFIYVASSDSVAEWSVRGAEKRWWLQSDWC